MIKIIAREKETSSLLLKRFRRATLYRKIKFKEKEYFVKPSKRHTLKSRKKVYIY